MTRTTTTTLDASGVHWASSKIVAEKVLGERPGVEAVSVNPVVDAPDPRRPVAEFAGPVAGGQHHCASTVGLGRQVGSP